MNIPGFAAGLSASTTADHPIRVVLGPLLVRLAMCAVPFLLAAARDVHRTGSMRGATGHRSASRHRWDVALLLFMVIESTVIRLRGIDTLLSPDTPPVVVGILLFAVFLVACVVLIVVPSELSLVDSYGRWVIVVIRVVQAGFFSAVFLFVPLPWVLLRFVVSFFMAGGYSTLSNLSAHYGLGSRLSGNTTSRDSDSSFTRNSILAGLLLGILGSLAIVGFVNRVSAGFDPLAGNVLNARISRPATSGNQSDALLAALWIAVGLIVLAANIARRVKDRRDQVAYASGFERMPRAPEGVGPSYAERVADVPEPPEAASPPIPVSRTTLSNNRLTGPDALRRIRDLVGRGDISLVRFDRSLSHASVYIEHLSEQEIESVLNGTLGDLVKGLPETVQIDLVIGRIYFAGSDTVPYFKNGIVARKSDVDEDVFAPDEKKDADTPGLPEDPPRAAGTSEEPEILSDARDAI